MLIRWHAAFSEGLVWGEQRFENLTSDYRARSLWIILTVTTKKGLKIGIMKSCRSRNHHLLLSSHAFNRHGSCFHAGATPQQEDLFKATF
jgi:hypothetical protein